MARTWLENGPNYTLALSRSRMVWKSAAATAHGLQAMIVRLLAGTLSSVCPSILKK